MKCCSCDVVLSDDEQKRKYKNHEEIKNPEDRYVGLCNRCFKNAFFENEELEYHEPTLMEEGDCC